MSSQFIREHTCLAFGHGGPGSWNDGLGWMHYECEGSTVVEHRKELFKKRGNMNCKGVTIYFVSYYTAGDKETLQRPSQEPLLQYITLRPELAAQVPSV